MRRRWTIAPRPTEHRGVGEHRALVGAEAVEAGRHQAPQRVGEGVQLGRRRHAVEALGGLALAEQRDQLLEEERVAAAAVEQRVAHVVGQRPADQRLEQLRGGRRPRADRG